MRASIFIYIIKTTARGLVEICRMILKKMMNLHSGWETITYVNTYNSNSYNIFLKYIGVYTVQTYWLHKLTGVSRWTVCHLSFIPIVCTWL